MKGGVRPINKHFFRNKSVGTFFFSCWYRLYIVHTSFSMWLMPKLNTNSKLYVILRHFFALTLVNVPLYELSTWEWKACLFVENFCEVPWNFHKWTHTRDLAETKSTNVIQCFHSECIHRGSTITMHTAMTNHNWLKMFVKCLNIFNLLYLYATRMWRQLNRVLWIMCFASKL